MRQLYAVAVLLLAWALPALAAEKLAPLDGDFLEYLASFGNDEENWALFADEEPAADPPPPAKDPAAKRDESESKGKTEAAAKAAEQR
jgi:hypothetical protein